MKLTKIDDDCSDRINQSLDKLHDIFYNPIICPRPNHDLIIQHISVVIKCDNDLSHDNYEWLIVDTACCDLK